MADLGGYEGGRQASLPGLPSARHWGRPPAASTSAPARPQQQLSQRPLRGAGRRKAAQPASAPAKLVKSQGRWRARAGRLWILLFRRWWPHNSFPWRRAGWRIFCFLLVLLRHCKSVGKHDLVIRLLRGARRLNPLHPDLVPSWHLPSVLTALKEAFKPLQSVELKFLSLKTVLLAALATVKRVGDLQAFLVDDSYLEFRVTLTLSWDPSLDMCPKFPPCPSGIRWWTCNHCPGRRQTGPLLCSVPFMPCASMWIARRASGPQTSSLSASEDSRRGRLSPNKELPTG